MGWSLVCACWQSVRNICFGRCCGHMIPSIHKVPACPFTATVHCFALHRRSHNDHISCILTVQCIARKRQRSSLLVVLFDISDEVFFLFYFYFFIQATFSSLYLRAFFFLLLIMYLSQRKSYAPFQPFTVSWLNVRNTPMFPPTPHPSFLLSFWFNAWRLCPWTTLFFFYVTYVMQFFFLTSSHSK